MRIKNNAMVLVIVFLNVGQVQMFIAFEEKLPSPSRTENFALTFGKPKEVSK